MTTPSEHGAIAVRDQVANLLIADLPGRISGMVHLWALGEKEIPTPDMITSGEAADNALDHRGDTWVEVITPRLMPRTRAMGLNELGYMIYRYRYTARIYVWVLSKEWKTTLDQRDRLAAACRDSLMTYPTLAPPPAFGDTGFLLNPATISEESSEPLRLKTTHVRAAALLAYEIDHEYPSGIPSTLPDLGTFNTLDLRVTLVPFTHPIGA